MPTHTYLKQTQLSRKLMTADSVYDQQPILSPHYTAHCFTITLKNLLSCNEVPLKERGARKRKKMMWPCDIQRSRQN